MVPVGQGDDETGVHRDGLVRIADLGRSRSTVEVAFDVRTRERCSGSGPKAGVVIPPGLARRPNRPLTSKRRRARTWAQTRCRATRVPCQLRSFGSTVLLPRAGLGFDSMVIDFLLELFQPVLITATSTHFLVTYGRTAL